MVLYTTVPLEEVFKDDSNEILGNTFQVPFERGLIELQLTSATTGKIVRLLSNDINDYLHPKLQPGTDIELKWEFK